LIKFTLLKPVFASIVEQKGTVNEIGETVYNSNVSLSPKKHGTGGQDINSWEGTFSNELSVLLDRALSALLPTP